MADPAINVVLCDARDDAARLVGALTAIASVQPHVHPQASLTVMREAAKLLHSVTDSLLTATVALEKQVAHG